MISVGELKEKLMIRHDLANHRVYGDLVATVFILATLLAMHFTSVLIPFWWVPAVVGLAMVVIVAFAVENHSRNTGQGTESGEDFWHTVLGGLPVLLVYVIAVVTVIIGLNK